MSIPTSINDLATVDSSNSPQGGDPVGGNIDDYLRAHAGIIARQFKAGTDIPSSSVLAVPVDGTFFTVTGTTTITQIQAAFPGKMVTLRFGSTLKIANSASLAMPSGMDYRTLPGDVLQFLQVDSSAWLCIHAPSTLPPGIVASTTSATAPAGWFLCNGAPISRTDFSGLFSIIQTTYGTGDGSTTFNLPDARGLILRGFDAGRGIDAGRVLGSYQEQDVMSHAHTGTTNSDGSHTHTGSTDVAGSHAHGGLLDRVQTGVPYGSTEPISPVHPTISRSTDPAGDHVHTITLGGGTHSHAFTTNASGSETRMKNLAMNFIIKW